MDKIEFDLDLFAEELPDQAQYFGGGGLTASPDIRTATAFTAASTVSGSSASSVSTLSV